VLGNQGRAVARLLRIWRSQAGKSALFGNLHRRGGIVFSLISLSILMGFLCLLRKMERHGHGALSPGEDHAGLPAPPAGRIASIP